MRVDGNYLDEIIEVLRAENGIQFRERCFPRRDDRADRFGDVGVVSESADVAAEIKIDLSSASEKPV